MFIRYQLYKGYIEMSNHNILNQIEKDIQEDVNNNVLDEELAIRLYDLIKYERQHRLKIASV